MISNSINNEQNYFIMKKITVDKEKCLACGACALSCNLIEEDSYGKAQVISPGIVTDDVFASVQKVVTACPSKALTFTEHRSMVYTQGIEGLNELKQVILEKLDNYSLLMPEPVEYTLYDYRFDKTIFSFPWIEPWTSKSGTSYERTDYDGYRSERKAEQEGRAEFDSIWYSRLRTLIQMILIDYKDRYLRKYYEYKKNDSSFYSGTNYRVEQLLKQIVSEAQHLAENKLHLPDEFEKFEVVPVLDDVGSLYQLKHFEETSITTKILERRESLSWYGDYISTFSGGSETSFFGRETEKYHYDLSNAVESLEKWTLSDIESEVNRSIGRLIENALSCFCENVKKATKDKASILIKAINTCIEK